MIELKVEHVVDIARALGMEPEEMMAFVYPELKDPPSTAAAELWKRMGGTAPTGTFIIRKQEEVPVIAILPEAEPPPGRAVACRWNVLFDRRSTFDHPSGEGRDPEGGPLLGCRLPLVAALVAAKEIRRSCLRAIRSLL